MRLHRWLVLLGMTALLCLAGVAPPAAANELELEGSTLAEGYAARVAVRLSGDAAPRDGATMMLRVRPSCWWVPVAGPNHDAAAMLAWYDDITRGAPTRGMIDLYGDRKLWADGARREREGEDITWYRGLCRDPADLNSFAPGAAEVFDGAVPGNPQTYVTFHYRAFAETEPPPAPLLEPEDLALAAREVMVIPPPETDRNPRIASAGSPTLIGLPTWFWVVRRASVGGDTGTRTIRAEVAGVWAEVLARTGGLRLTSPGGGALCPPARATTRYGPGVAESSACTVSFDRASVGYPGGYPVTASTGWVATWTGSGDSAGTLDPLTRSVTVQVPVAEVQNVVTD